MIFLFGTLAYVSFLGVFLYAIGFMGNFAVPKSIDSGTPYTLGDAFLVNVGLILLLAVQHSIMARPQFKEWWTKLVGATIERSIYVLLTNLIFVVMFWQWRAIPEPVWTVENETLRAILWAIFGLGWVLVVYASFLIDHFDLFGMRQVWLHAKGKPYTPPVFQVASLYKIVRHPLLLGWNIAFWVTPDMTVGHLLFAVTTTLYMLAAIRLEERDLLAAHGEDYGKYRSKVSMLLPIPRGKG